MFDVKLTPHAEGWIDAQMRLVPPVFATEDYVAGYRMGVSDRLHEARVAIEELRVSGALSMRDVLAHEMQHTED